MAKNSRNKTYIVGRDSKTGHFVSVKEARRSPTTVAKSSKRAPERVVNEYHTVKDSSAKILSKISRKRCVAIKSLAKR